MTLFKFFTYFGLCQNFIEIKNMRKRAHINTQAFKVHKQRGGGDFYFKNFIILLLKSLIYACNLTFIKNFPGAHTWNHRCHKVGKYGDLTEIFSNISQYFKNILVKKYFPSPIFRFIIGHIIRNLGVSYELAHGSVINKQHMIQELNKK